MVCGKSHELCIEEKKRHRWNLRSHSKERLTRRTAAVLNTLTSTRLLASRTRIQVSEGTPVCYSRASKNRNVGKEEIVRDRGEETAKNAARGIETRRREGTYRCVIRAGCEYTQSPFCARTHYCNKRRKQLLETSSTRQLRTQQIVNKWDAGNEHTHV